MSGLFDSDCFFQYVYNWNWVYLVPIIVAPVFSVFGFSSRQVLGGAVLFVFPVIVLGMSAVALLKGKHDFLFPIVVFLLAHISLLFLYTNPFNFDALFFSNLVWFFLSAVLLFVLGASKKTEIISYPFMESDKEEINYTDAAKIIFLLAAVFFVYYFDVVQNNVFLGLSPRGNPNLYEIFILAFSAIHLWSLITFFIGIISKTQRPMQTLGIQVSVKSNPDDERKEQ